MTRPYRILIIGRTPPPIGGVTIHTSRLLEACDGKYKRCFMALTWGNLLRLPFVLPRYQKAHLHASNVWVMLWFVCVCWLTKTYSILTIHRDFGIQRGYLGNWLECRAVAWSKKPVLLNQKSLSLAEKINKSAEMISSFIPPRLEREYLPLEAENRIQTLKKQYGVVFCSNAYKLVVDGNGEELYGIWELFDAFERNPQVAFVLSDPSRTYAQYVQEQARSLPPNIYIIEGEHSYYKVMSLCSASIRNTTTDGDSVSVKESLFLGLPTFVTDVVSRPTGCRTYKRGSFARVLSEIDLQNLVSQTFSVENAVERLMEIYDN